MKDIEHGRDLSNLPLQMVMAMVALPLVIHVPITKLLYAINVSAAEAKSIGMLIVHMNLVVAMVSFM